MPADQELLDNYNSQYADIKLDELEIAEALFHLRKKKHAIIAEKEYWAKVGKEQEPLKLDKPGMEKFIYDKALKLGIELLFDKYNDRIFNLLIQYFTNDPEFENSGYSLKKGILIQGGVGCGKTTLLKLFTDNPKQSYVMSNCNLMASNFTKAGYSEIEKYFSPIKFPRDVFGFTSRGVCFDDLGTEKNKKYFGNEANVMEEIILGWYNKFHNNSERIHITTNLSVSDIDILYGTRVRSRMREMFNVLEFDLNAPDRRK